MLLRLKNANDHARKDQILFIISYNSKDREKRLKLTGLETLAEDSTKLSKLIGKYCSCTNLTN